MLRSMNDLEGYAMRATDGIVGHVKDFYFDDKAWVIRYLVVDTGPWLFSRKVLISPIAIGSLNWMEKILPVSITKEQVKNSPDIDTDKPVSRQHEMQYLGYYGYPYYWGGAGLWGGGLYPNIMMPGDVGFVSTPPAMQSEAQKAYMRAEAARHENDDPHLRSCKAVEGYNIHATEGDIGHVQGLFVEERTWAIRYIVVDTSNWWLGHLVLIAPQWIQDVSWPDANVSVNLTRQAVKNAPPYDPAVTLDRRQESGIYKHYGRPGYWEDGSSAKPQSGDKRCPFGSTKKAAVRYFDHADAVEAQTWLTETQTPRRQPTRERNPMTGIEQLELDGHRGEIIAGVKSLSKNIVRFSIGMYRISIKALRTSLSWRKCCVGAGCLDTGLPDQEACLRA